MVKKQSETPHTESGNSFVSIRQLLDSENMVPIGLLVTAIEQNGIYAKDDFGRYELHQNNSAMVQKIFKRLAAKYRYDAEPMTVEGEARLRMADSISEEDTVGCTDFLSEVGWAKEVLPNFETPQLEFSDASNIEKALSQPERVSLLIIIATLCGQLKIKHDERGAAAKIVKMADEIGASISDDTVKRVLKQIPEAIESRTK